MRTLIHKNIDEIPAASWNYMVADRNPFLRHEFLAALEHSDSVGEKFGWIPQHLALYNDQQQLMGATPLYLKYNSYGEFVFDWAWAEAYERAGLAYYPKLVSAIPYTPATGGRLLLHPALDAQQREHARSQLVAATIHHAQQLQSSSLHWLFPTNEESATFEEHGLMRRIDCQFHWHNLGYQNFDDFLQSLTARKRKNIRQERRHAQSHALTIEMVSGNNATEEQLQAAERFYRTTFDKKWGHATLNLEFFHEIAATMGEQLILMLAKDKQRYVAGAICYRGENTLYGRHWGCIAEYHSLHFELCYYQGIEYCIREGLQHFEPGAQGEHKLSRGFLPTVTQSYHWIANAQFRAALQEHVQHERSGIRRYIEELQTHTPYRAEHQTAPQP